MMEEEQKRIWEEAHKRNCQRGYANEKRRLNLLWEKHNPYVAISREWLENKLRKWKR